MKLLLLLWLSSLLSAEIAADPISLHATNRDWFLVSNDNLVPNQPDDYLTAGFHGATHLYGLKVGLEYDLFTSKPEHIRSDKATMIIGNTLAVNNFEAFGGVGLSYSGELGGQYIQTIWHRYTQVSLIVLPYERPVVKPEALADLRYTIQYHKIIGITPIFQVQTDGAYLTTESTLECWFANVYEGEESRFVVGPVYTYSCGKQPTRTQQITAHFYNEWAVMVGLRLPPVICDIHMGHKGCYGELGFTF